MHLAFFLRSIPRRMVHTFGILTALGVLAATLPAGTPHGPATTAPSERVCSDQRPASTGSISADCRAEQLSNLGAARWHAAGYRARGVKVAILDSGFRGYREHLGKALPGRVTARSFRKDGNLEAKDSQHGILCGEVVHALAPEAELLFANWEPDVPEAFLEAVRWARKEGAKVVSCSVIMPSYSDGAGGGPVHKALARTLGAGDSQVSMLCFASAGNTAQRHWAGRFDPDGDGFHQWAQGEPDNVLTPWGDDRVSVEMFWQPGADYDLHVYDKDTAAEVGRSPACPVAGRCSAVVRFQPEPGHAYRVRVRSAGKPAGTLHLVALHSGLGHSTAAGSVMFPADGPAVVAVGAVDERHRRKDYSACGPVPGQTKPDLVACVPFVSAWRDRPFAGTSAAAPQAAALAALCWSRHPDWTADQVRTALRTAALDAGPPGHDPETGYGVINLPAEAAKSPGENDRGPLTTGPCVRRDCRLLPPSAQD